MSGRWWRSYALALQLLLTVYGSTTLIELFGTKWGVVAAIVLIPVSAISVCIPLTEPRQGQHHAKE